MNNPSCSGKESYSFGRRNSAGPCSKAERDYRVPVGSALRRGWRLQVLVLLQSLSGSHISQALWWGSAESMTVRGLFRRTNDLGTLVKKRAGKEMLLSKQLKPRLELRYRFSRPCRGTTVGGWLKTFRRQQSMTRTSSRTGWVSRWPLCCWEESAVSFQESLSGAREAQSQRAFFMGWTACPSRKI